MRRSTPFAPFSRVVLLAAIGGLGVTIFVPFAHAADAPKSTAAPVDKATPTAPSPAPAPQASDKTASAGATAPDKKTRDAARKAYGEGEKAYAAGDFASAYTGYARANELIPSAHAMYWAAKSLDQGGRAAEARKAYETLLADPGSSKIGNDKVSDAQSRLAALKTTLVGEVTVSTVPAAAALAVDGVAQPGPMPVVLKLAPGPHKLTFTAEGFDAKEVELQVAAGTKFDQNIELQQHIAAPLAPPAKPLTKPVVAAAPPPPPPEPYSKVPAYVTLGIAGAGAVVGTIFGVKALQSKGDYNDNPTTKSADDTERNALIADMAFGVAVTLGVTGIVLLTTSDDVADAPKAASLRLPPKTTFRVLPYVGRESGGATARLTF